MKKFVILLATVILGGFATTSKTSTVKGWLGKDPEPSAQAQVNASKSQTRAHQLRKAGLTDYQIYQWAVQNGYVTSADPNDPTKITAVFTPEEAYKNAKEGQAIYGKTYSPIPIITKEGTFMLGAPELFGVPTEGMWQSVGDAAPTYTKPESRAGITEGSWQEQFSKGLGTLAPLLAGNPNQIVIPEVNATWGDLAASIPTPSQSIANWMALKEYGPMNYPVGAFEGAAAAPIATPGYYDLSTLSDEQMRDLWNKYANPEAPLTPAQQAAVASLGYPSYADLLTPENVAKMYGTPLPGTIKAK